MILSALKSQTKALNNLILKFEGFLQGALYGIIVCGITSFRIWFGPLPEEICHFQAWAAKVVLWYSIFTWFFISLAKFMYICVWKHMRDMNDDLIVTFLVRIAVFISIWVSATGFNHRKGAKAHALCTGIFNDHEQIMNPIITPDNLPQPYNPIFCSLMITILFLMAAVTIGRYKNSLDDDSLSILRRPKDLESMLLNFALTILIFTIMFGYNLYWRG